MILTGCVCFRYTKAFDALVEEASIEEVPQSKPSLIEILDEWSMLKALGVPREEVGEAGPPDLASVVGSNCCPATSMVSSVVSKSAALCCTFDSSNNLVWGEASRLVHFRDRDVSIPDASSGGVLCLATAPGNVVIAGTMSGRLFVSEEGGEFSALASSHSKYAHRVCARGKFFVSASHDRSVFVWDLATKKLLKEWHFPAICEALCFYGESQLLVGVRDSNLLRLFDLSKLCDDPEVQPALLNLNAFGDDHVSFSVLDLASFVGNRQLIAVASDRDRVFVYWLTDAAPPTCCLVATLTGMSSDSMSAARCCFSPCGALL